MRVGLVIRRPSTLVLLDNDTSGRARRASVDQDEDAITEGKVVLVAEPIHIARAAVPLLIEELERRASDEHPHILKFCGVIPLSPDEYAGSLHSGSSHGLLADDYQTPEGPRRRQRRRRLQHQGQRLSGDFQQRHTASDALGRPCVFLASVWEICRPLQYDDLVAADPAPGMSRLRQIMPIALSISRAVQFLASMGIAHGSVKYENIVIGADGRVKLACFDCYSGQEDEVRCCDRAPAKVNRSAAPELLRQMNDTGRRASSFAGDVYAIGVLAIELATGEAPFGTLSDEEIEEKVLRGDLGLRPEDRGIIRDTEWHLLSALLAFDPELRPSIDEVVDMFAAIAYGQAEAFTFDNWGRLRLAWPQERERGRSCRSLGPQREGWMPRRGE